jgi:hypothetical protein
MKFIEQDYYSRSDLMKLFNCSRTAIVRLENLQLFKISHIDGAGNGVTFYTRDSVFTFWERRKNVVSIKELEFKWKINRNIIQRLANDVDVLFKEDREIYPTGTRIVDIKDVAILEQAIHDYFLNFETNKFRKNMFMSGIFFLFQRFRDVNGQQYRLTEESFLTKPNLNYGFNTEDGFLKLDTALKLGFTPVYHVKKKLVRSANYVGFKVDADDARFLQLIDIIYIYFGYNNFYLDVQDKVLMLYIRADVYNCHSSAYTKFLATEYVPKSDEGTMRFNKNQIQILSDYCAFSTLLKRETRDAINQFAIEQDMKISDVIELAIQQLKVNKI